MKKSILFNEHSTLTKNFSIRKWYGEPNKLSAQSIVWKQIEDVSKITVSPSRVSSVFVPPKLIVSPNSSNFYPNPNIHAAKIIRQRRSAQEMDNRVGITLNQFFSMLQKTRKIRKFSFIYLMFFHKFLLILKFLGML